MMDGMTDSLETKEVFSVCVRNPHAHKEHFWHTHLDYEIYLYTNSMCFRKKTSCVRRRYSEFAWLRQRLQDNALLIEVPKIPPWKPFFNLGKSSHIAERMQGLQRFLEDVLQIPVLLSDSCLHLFLQSQLTIAKMEACARGQTRYSVAQAIQGCNSDMTAFLKKDEEIKTVSDSDCDSITSSGLGHSIEPTVSLCEDTSTSEDHC